jgi:murein DD-endopeptidase MepM/ murein hydrolase activator NlpD
VHRVGRLARFPVFAALVVLLIGLSTSIGGAQLGVIPTPTPSPARSPQPTLTPLPSTPTPSADPVPSEVPIPVTETPVPEPEKTIEPEEPLEADPTDVLEEDELPEGLDDLVVPSFPRTRPRNTVALVRALRPLTELGIPLEQVLIDGMGRFPVAGLAHYYDDWLNPRFTPKPHLHEGLDIFADFGTPVRSPDAGVVSQLSEHGAGGIAVWVRAQDGTSYYFAHLLERVEGIHVGQRVEIGSVLGYVGDTGNAQGGTPHLHFEIHPGGGEAIPPKPSVDAWLDEAEQRAPGWVQALKADVRAKRQILGSAPGGLRTKTSNKEIQTSMLLTLLDPVGGSVGMLPNLELGPRRSGAVSDRLLAELIATRVEGRLFVPSDRLRSHD